MLPQKLQKKPRKTERIRSPAHRAWVRSHHCCVPNCNGMPIECAHVRLGSHAGMAQKPDDDKTISLCASCHRQLHAQGEATFAKTHKLDLHALAAEFALKSPHRMKLMRTSYD